METAWTNRRIGSISEETKSRKMYDKTFFTENDINVGGYALRISIYEMNIIEDQKYCLIVSSDVQKEVKTCLYFISVDSLVKDIKIASEMLHCLDLVITSFNKEAVRCNNTFFSYIARGLRELSEEENQEKNEPTILDTLYKLNLDIDAFSDDQCKLAQIVPHKVTAIDSMMERIIPKLIALYGGVKWQRAKNISS